MEYTIQQLASLAGVSARTLRWYDEIGLLCPAGKSPAGYRQYGPAQVERLQQILFYRALGLPLSGIARVLDAPDFDKAAAMERHLVALLAEQNRLGMLIKNAQHSLLAMKGEINMNDQDRFAGFKKEKLEENERLYGAEIRQQYGEEQVAASNEKWLNLREDEMAAMRETEEELREVLREATGQQSPPEELALRAFQLHRRWLGFTWPRYSPKAHLGLCHTYEADPRFAAYYEEMAPGGMAFLCKAIRRYAEQED